MKFRQAAASMLPQVPGLGSILLVNRATPCDHDLLMSYKITVDVGIMNASAPIDGMETLNRWAKEGKVEIAQADAPKAAPAQPYNWPGAAPKPAQTWRDSQGGRRGRPRKSNGDNGQFRSLAAILYPSKDSQKLAMDEINDVAHILIHYTSKNTFFVTQNQKTFLEGGKREQLKASLGILAMTPKETVEALAQIEGWK